MFKNKDEAIFYIENIKRKEKRTNLNRMHRALEMLGNPERAYKVIHVAGTNGKGSTVSYLTNILREAGFSVGSFISPYVIKFNERIMYNLSYISDEDLVKYANIIYDLKLKLEEEDEVITFFEFITLMGLLYFKDKHVDFAVVEVGLGGVLDATNIFDHALRIITNIGFDHMNALGNTLSEIADKKLGILHENEKLISAVDESLLKQFEDHSKELNSRLYWVNKDIKDIKESFNGVSFKYKNEAFRTPLLGIFQAYNAALAIEAIRQIMPDISSSTIQSALDKTAWPGRLQIIKHKPIILIDGGHNIHGIDAVVKSIKGLTNQKIHVLFTALKDKEIDKMLRALDEIASDYIFTTINDSRASSIMDILAVNQKPYKAIDYYKEALSYLDNFGPDEIILVTGSLHFISLVINFLKK
ncbi:MAG: bifunctional folylpolyglutamate synthase/dihydrofolate synthase [Acholeplasmatales bacterium]|nr:bifunctional folylpolyglutamate synthase/dihydrofolate synthase [Acholeplasmatales bacterium]